MRLIALFAVLIALTDLSSCAQMESLTVPEAEKKVGSVVSVQFLVKGEGRNGELAELYSEPAWDRPGNFFVRITACAQKELQAKGIRDLNGHFADETVIVKGKVERLNFQDKSFPLIKVESLSNLTIVPRRGKYTPTSEYLVQHSQGFEVRYHPVFKSQRKSEREIVSREITKQLLALSGALPKDKVRKLRIFPIWVEWNRLPNNAAMFHPGRRWLRENSVNPDKAPGVEITSAVNFVKWSRESQPSMLIHEFAHAFQDNVLGPAENKAIKQVFNQVSAKGIYNSVPHVQGGRGRHYALTNEREYFAEATEAYFGKNDFFPFTRRDLKRHDPLGFNLIEKMWNLDFTKQGEKGTPCRFAD